MTRPRTGVLAALLVLPLAGCAAQQPERPPATVAPSAAAEPFDDPAAVLAERKRLTRPIPLDAAAAPAASAAPPSERATTQPEATSTANPETTPTTWTRAQCEYASQAEWIDTCRQYGDGLSPTSTGKLKVVVPVPVPGTPLPRNAPRID